MYRVIVAVLLLVLVLLVAGGLYLGAFPPAPHVQQIEKTLPNDRFQRAP